jgi:hypothetical protein
MARSRVAYASIAVTVLALLTSACAAGVRTAPIRPAASRSPGSTAVLDAVAGKQDADRLLAEFPVPAGAERLAGQPSGVAIMEPMTPLRAIAPT